MGARPSGDVADLPRAHRGEPETREAESDDTRLSQWARLGCDLDARIGGSTQERESDDAEKGQSGQSGRQGDQGAGGRQAQPDGQSGHAELLHERLEDEPLGDESDRRGQAGQGDRAGAERRPTPTQPSSDASQRVELVGARDRFDIGQGGEQRRLGDGVGHRLEGGGQEAHGDQGL